MTPKGLIDRGRKGLDCKQLALSICCSLCVTGTHAAGPQPAVSQPALSAPFPHPEVAPGKPVFNLIYPFWLIPPGLGSSSYVLEIWGPGSYGRALCPFLLGICSMMSLLKAFIFFPCFLVALNT